MQFLGALQVRQLQQPPGGWQYSGAKARSLQRPVQVARYATFQSKRPAQRLVLHRFFPTQHGQCHGQCHDLNSHESLYLKFSLEYTSEALGGVLADVVASLWIHNCGIQAGAVRGPSDSEKEEEQHEIAADILQTEGSEFRDQSGKPEPLYVAGMKPSPCRILLMALQGEQRTLFEHSVHSST